VTAPEARPLPADSVGLLEGLTTTRAIRRYTGDPMPPEVLRDILFAATRAASGSNRQPFRFIVLIDGPRAVAARRLLGERAREIWAGKGQREGYRSDAEPRSAKARMARTMAEYVEGFESVPVVVLPCLVRYREPAPMEGASVYPACQNLLLAARALGYGGVMTGFHRGIEPQLSELLSMPAEAFIAATITLGRPQGGHGPVRRRPLAELVFEDTWGSAPEWALDPPGTAYTAAGPPARPSTTAG
jgi:nitroreductase